MPVLEAAKVKVEHEDISKMQVVVVVKGSGSTLLD